MQCAFASKSTGMPLSGASMTSESTTAASFSRFASSSSAAHSGETPPSSPPPSQLLISLVHLPVARLQRSTKPFPFPYVRRL